MKELVKISCYIEEYSNQNGKLCARLRDKASNKKSGFNGAQHGQKSFIKVSYTSEKYIKT